MKRPFWKILSAPAAGVVLSASALGSPTPVKLTFHF